MHFVRGQATGVPARVISGPWDFVGLQGACHTVIIKIAVKKNKCSEDRALLFPNRDYPGSGT